MTLEECYAQLQGNYENAKARLMSDTLVEKFLLKFPADPTMDELRAALAAGNTEAAFRVAHTLKGVAGNLSLDALTSAAADLTEQLRPLPTAADPALVAAVETAYQRTVVAIDAYRS